MGFSGFVFGFEEFCRVARHNPSKHAEIQNLEFASIVEPSVHEARPRPAPIDIAEPASGGNKQGPMWSRIPNDTNMLSVLNFLTLFGIFLGTE